MLHWAVFAILTAIAVLAVLIPLSRGRTASSRADSDIAVYKDQLAEIDRDLDRGLIAASEAEAARLEVARRLLAADAAQAQATAAQGATLRRRAAAVIGLVAIPAITLSLYARLGSPDLPDQPLVARLEAPADAATIDELVARVEAHLERQPEDGEGWEVLGPVYMRAGRSEDARKAFANALRILGPTAIREANLGEAIVATSNGVVTAEARAAFERAKALDAALPKPRYYLGLAAEQDGDKQVAIKTWETILAETAPDGPIAAFLKSEIGRVSGTPPVPAPLAGPTAEDVAAAQDMQGADRNDMIKGMVERLATRLAEQGGSSEEWQRLIQSYVVLGERDKATAAVAQARKSLAEDPAALKSIDAIVKSLGLEG